MGWEMATESSWFGNLRRHSRKGAPDTDKEVVGILAFEIAGLMTKVVSLWHSLTDEEIHRLRDEIMNSIGVRKLVADDDNYLMDLALNEIMENLGQISRNVARLAGKCLDPHFRRFEHFVNDPVQNNIEWFGWAYRLKKMERKVKKMERFIAFTTQLAQELEVLAEFEQTLRRMQANPGSDQVTLLEHQQKVMRQHEEVKNIREMSPWVRSYDYIVRLLARSLLTTLERIKFVFVTNRLPSANGYNDCRPLNSDFLHWSHSFASLSLIHPSENILCGISSGLVGRSGLNSEKRKINSKHQQLYCQLPTKRSHSKNKHFAHVGSLKGCMMSGDESPILQGCRPAVGGSMRLAGDCTKNVEEMEPSILESHLHFSRIYSKLALFNSKHGLLTAPSFTLGDAALALHYAYVITLIEKLVSSPHIIDLEAREELYNMLTMTIRASLRARLKAYAKSLASHISDSYVAAEWSMALLQILDWLSPLAHNTIRWQSVRNFEKEQQVSRSKVFLVQTLYYANQAKTEAAITELLLGLNYICHGNRELNKKTAPESSGSRSTFSYMLRRNG